VKLERESSTVSADPYRLMRLVFMVLPLFYPANLTCSMPLATRCI
jgi:hypothetical protein